MARIELPPGDGEDGQRMWTLRPEFGKAAKIFSDAIQDHSILPLREHEAARIRIAHINGCIPCSGARVDHMEQWGMDESFYSDVDDPALRGRYTRREGLAIEFAERFAAGKDAFDDLFWKRMGDAYSAAEIVDLAASCAKWLGLGRLNAVMDLDVSCPIKLAGERSPRKLAG